MFGETTISYVMIGNHPIDFQPKKLVFRVPGLCIYSVVILSPAILMFYLLFRTLPFIEDVYFLFESNMAERTLKWLTQTPTKTNALHELS